MYKVIKTNIASCAIHFIDKRISSILFLNVCMLFSFEKTTADSKGVWNILKHFGASIREEAHFSDSLLTN